MNDGAVRGGGVELGDAIHVLAKRVRGELEAEESGSGETALHAPFKHGANGLCDGLLNIRSGLKRGNVDVATAAGEIAVESAVGLTGDSGRAALFLVELDVDAVYGRREAADVERYISAGIGKFLR